MLVLSRKLKESIVIADDIVIHFLRSHGNRIEIGIEAPRDVLVLRSELCVVEPPDNQVLPIRKGPNRKPK